MLIHDAARPIIPAGTVAALLAALAAHEGAIPAVPVSDTLKRGSQGEIVETVPRAGLFRAQTPQAFRYATILRLHQQAEGSRGDRRCGIAGGRRAAGGAGGRC